jgi:alpha-galactosidase/6-phospho-beta-glucosidase family protein
MIAGVANAGRIPGLPAEATVEGLVTFSAEGHVQPAPLVDLPPLAASLLARHATYERLALEAADDPNPVRLERALLANPMVATADQARALTERLCSPDLARAPLTAPA